jgi:hypothetical protein
MNESLHHMRIHKSKGISLLTAITVLAMCFVSAAQDKPKLDITPEELYQTAINNPGFQKSPDGEGFCWQARGAMGRFLSYYHLTKDTEWLDAGVKYYDFLVDKMATAPDGYKGWIGAYLSDRKYWQDVLVGDALITEGLLNFSVLVLEDKQLKKRYKAKADEYVRLAEKHFAEKYDSRGTWIDDGSYGAYVGSTKFLAPGDLSKWVTRPGVSEAGMSPPFNKQMDAGLVFLLLHRATGKKAYHHRAEKIYLTAKSRFQFYDDHYSWNYWEPLIPTDVDLKKKDARHGVWVHPWRSGYTAREVGQIVEAYHYGVVFDATDIQRLINTNLKLMWNGDRVNPKFISSNGQGAEMDTTGRAAFRKRYGHSNETKNAGELWTALLDFDQTICDLYELRFKDKTSPSYLTYKNTVLKNPPGFDRHHAKGNVKVPVVNFTESKDLYMAAVLPHSIKKGQEAIIICKSWNPGELKIDLYSAKGKKLANLYTGTIAKGGTHIETWDGKDPQTRKPYKGRYKVRWSINDGYREFPVVFN